MYTISIGSIRLPSRKMTMFINMWVAPGAQSSQEFAAKLGIVGNEEFVALLTRDVEMADDGGVLVPQKVKKSWQRWCLKGHPDRGGGDDAYMAMYQQYETFKNWFPKRFEHENHERGEQKKRAVKAEEAAQIARAENRHEEAEKYAKQAIAAYRALHEYWTHEMKQASMQPAAIDLQRAQELLDAICQEAEEAENERREKQEHRDLTSGLNSFFNSVCGIVDGLAITQKFDKLRAFFDEKEKESKAEIVRLEDDTHKKDEKMQKMLVEIADLDIQLRDAKSSCTELQASQERHMIKVRQLEDQITEMQQDKMHWTTALANFAKGTIGMPVSSSARLPKPANLTAYIKLLEEEKEKVNDRFKEMQSELEVCKNEAAEATKRFNRELGEERLRNVHMDKEYDELLQTANLKEAKLAEVTQGTEKLIVEATNSENKIQHLNIQIEQLQKQCNSYKQQVVELKSNLAEQADKHQALEVHMKYITDVNQKASLSASEQRQESDGARSSVPGYDPTVYEETKTKVCASKNMFNTT